MLGKLLNSLYCLNLTHNFGFCNDFDPSTDLMICRVAQAYLNQKRLDAEAKQLHTSATNFAKQTQQWMNLIEGFSSALKV